MRRLKIKDIFPVQNENLKQTSNSQLYRGTFRPSNEAIQDYNHMDYNEGQIAISEAERAEIKTGIRGKVHDYIRYSIPEIRVKSIHHIPYMRNLLRQKKLGRILNDIILYNGKK